MANLRYKSLDGLRGCAAFSVVLMHCLYAIPAYWSASPIPGSPNYNFYSILEYTPLRTLINGSAAVLIFFVLSGFVLTIGLASDRSKHSYASFVSSRLIRIYPAFALSIALSALLYWVSSPIVDAKLSGWFADIWRLPLTLRLILGHLALIGTPSLMTLNDVMWTLVVELRVALLMPALVYLLMRWPVCTLVPLSVLGVLAMLSARHVNELYATWLISFSYVFLFASGGFLALHREKIIAKLKSLDLTATVMLLIVTILAYNEPFKPLKLPVAGLASIIIVAIALGCPIVVRFLLAPACMYLGRISYSLYLVHLPLLTFLVYAMGRKTSVLVVIPIAILASVIVADLFYRFVERPSHRLATYVGTTMAARRLPPGITA